MPWLQTNMALYVRLGAACWVPYLVPIYPSGMPRSGLCYYTLIHIMAHYRPSNNLNRENLVIKRKNDVDVTLSLHIITSLLLCP